ncbi:lysophospholipase [Fulvivirga sp. 29W222]|uniref:Monoacylglycerol lipase n=1 Tax=Fulvivirga marina TaxID=2494733 RepID=A0A937FUX6_9BACT|nr:alpha/beta hydrolase [Fulvivirga marina]MBL6446605.1 lysophospholipase [Fulvivirga marina]
MTEAIEFKTSDNLKLWGQVWFPETDAKGIVILIHGFGEHIQRYDHVAKAFNKANYVLAGIDLRGHGKSEGIRGHTPSYNHLLNDLRQFTDIIKDKFSTLPLFIYGHSMGGNVTANFLLRGNEQDFTAAIITSPWLKLRFDPPKIKVAMGRLVRKIYPKYAEHNNLNPNDLSRDTAVGKAYAEDPLVNNKITTEMYFSIVEAGDWALQNATSIQTPVLTMHGTDDPITSPQASEMFARKMTSEYKVWEGMYHEPHNELGKEEVIDTIVQWVKQHTP